MPVDRLRPTHSEVIVVPTRRMDLALSGMKEGRSFTRRAALICAVLAVTAGVGLRPAATPARAAENTPATLPAHAYTIQGKPSEVLQNHAAVLALALQVEKDLRADLAASAIADSSLIQRSYTTLLAVALLKRDHDGAVGCIERVRNLNQNPVGRVLTGLITGTYLEASAEPGNDLRAAFRKRFDERLASLPHADVQGTLQLVKGNLQATTPAQLVAGIEAGLDPAVTDGRLTQEMATGLLSAAMNLEIVMPLRTEAIAALTAYFSDHPGTPTSAAPSPTEPPVIHPLPAPLRGVYFGAARPGDRPVRFAPEILDSLSRWVEDISFSPDGRRCLVAVGASDYSNSRLYSSECVRGTWSAFQEVPFAADFAFTGEPVFSADGRTVTFTAIKQGAPDLWQVSWLDKGWGPPAPLPPPVNSEQREVRSSVMTDGTRYFGRAPAGLANQIYKAYRDASGAMVVKKLDAPINAQSYEGDPCIAPDGHFLVFYSGRIGGHGGTDLYASFTDGHGGWTTPVNLGDAFNGPDDEYGAHLSPDGKYLFYNRHSTQNGNQVFWVATSAIEKLGP